MLVTGVSQVIFHGQGQRVADQAGQRRRRRLLADRPAVLRAAVIGPERQARGGHEGQRRPGHGPRPALLPDLATSGTGEPYVTRRHGDNAAGTILPNLGPNNGKATLTVRPGLHPDLPGAQQGTRRDSVRPGRHEGLADPRRRGLDVGLGDRPGHLGCKRRHPGVPDRGRASPLARRRVRQRWSASYTLGAQPWVHGRARRRRAQHQPRPRPRDWE